MLTPIAFPPTIPLTHLPRGVVTLYPVEVEASVVSRLEKALEEKRNAIRKGHAGKHLGQRTVRGTLNVSEELVEITEEEEEEDSGGSEYMDEDEEESQEESE